MFPVSLICFTHPCHIASKSLSFYYVYRLDDQLHRTHELVNHVEVNQRAWIKSWKSFEEIQGWCVLRVLLLRHMLEHAVDVELKESKKVSKHVIRSHQRIGWKILIRSITYPHAKKLYSHYEEMSPLLRQQTFEMQLNPLCL